jgi:hypothetical protein
MSEQQFKCDNCKKIITEEEAIICTDCGAVFCANDKCENDDCPNDPRGHTTS